MKVTSKLTLGYFATATLFLGFRVNGQALTTVHFNIDRFGNGTYSVPWGPSGVLTASIVGDASSGNANAFGYLFPALPILAPASTPLARHVHFAESQIPRSDSVGFTRDSAAPGVILSYSGSPHPYSPADLFEFPTSLVANGGSITEGVDGEPYHPAPGQPGDLSAFGYDATYNLISEVPEASTSVGGFMFGIAGLYILRRRRKTRCLL